MIFFKEETHFLVECPQNFGLLGCALALHRTYLIGFSFSII